MSIELIKAHGLYATQRQREDDFFGLGFSHYPTPFRAEAGGVEYFLQVHNTPRRPKVIWGARVAGSDPMDLSDGLWAHLRLTPEESRILAGDLGINLGEWLAEALEACGKDVTPTSEVLHNVVDPSTFDATRSAGIEERG